MRDNITSLICLIEGYIYMYQKVFVEKKSKKKNVDDSEYERI